MRKILSKEEFVYYINKVKEVDRKWSEFYSLLDAWPGGEDKLALITECTNLLSFIMDDEEDSKLGTWISWWCWETDYGQNKNMNKVWMPKNSEEIELIIDTPEKLYDFLMSNIDEQEGSNKCSYS